MCIFLQPYFHVWIKYDKYLCLRFQCCSHRIATSPSVYVLIVVRSFVRVWVRRCLSAARHKYLQCPCRWFHLAVWRIAKHFAEHEQTKHTGTIYLCNVYKRSVGKRWNLTYSSVGVCVCNGHVCARMCVDGRSADNDDRARTQHTDANETCPITYSLIYAIQIKWRKKIHTHKSHRRRCRHFCFAFASCRRTHSNGRVAETTKRYTFTQ